jgi:hypothetical protein
LKFNIFVEYCSSSTFKVKEQAKQETIMNQAACTQKTELFIPTIVTTSFPIGYFLIS